VSLSKGSIGRRTVGRPARRTVREGIKVIGRDGWDRTPISFSAGRKAALVRSLLAREE